MLRDDTGSFVSTAPELPPTDTAPLDLSTMGVKDFCLGLWLRILGYSILLLPSLEKASFGVSLFCDCRKPWNQKEQGHNGSDIHSTERQHPAAVMCFQPKTVVSNPKLQMDRVECRRAIEKMT